MVERSFLSFLSFSFFCHSDKNFSYRDDCLFGCIFLSFYHQFCFSFQERPLSRCINSMFFSLSFFSYQLYFNNFFQFIYKCLSAYVTNVAFTILMGSVYILSFWSSKIYKLLIPMCFVYGSFVACIVLGFYMGHIEYPILLYYSEHLISNLLLLLFDFTKERLSSSIQFATNCNFWCLVFLLYLTYSYFILFYLNQLNSVLLRIIYLQAKAIPVY